ncbi:phage tail protein [Paenibacillus ehimensis]|uniref:phage tail protein n=1 Tax=Paenibacillus ehimensis TaxID=79264 RepID=UPI000FDA3472|nr:phage tail protein [Paenibacillus ehimensis]
MPKAAVTIYDTNMRRVALLENAFSIGYEMPLNALWTASFTLPANDEKNTECRPLYFVEIFEDDIRIDLFRITPNTARRSNDGQTITYQCEHVLATLLDDVMFQYHTVGNLGVYTADVLRYILQRQSTQRWQLGTVAFARQFEYNWENENLLGALFSVPKPFVETYQWTWDTTVYPWRLNLIAPSDQIEARIRYGVNLKGIEKTVDPTNLCTRLYGLGYGEGVNQLTFAELNAGKPYIDADTQAQYGVISRIFVDRRFEFPDTLLARCQALLNEMKTPRTTYRVQAAELYRLTKDPIDRFRTGSMIRIQDAELGVDVTARVVNVRKGDLYGAPGDVEIEIANRSQDISKTIADLANRQRINEVYAQGATNLDSHDFADNCDPQHPAIMRFYVPEETARINKVRLSYQVEPFRGYSKGNAAGGATTRTTSSGGGGVQTSSAGGGTTTTTTSGGGSTPTTSTQPMQTPTTTVDSQKIVSSNQGMWGIGQTLVPSALSVEGRHNHGFNNGDVFVLADGTYRVFVESGEHAHNIVSTHDHTVTVPAHSHNVTIPAHNHTVTIQSHSHDVTIPSHTHDVTIPDHSHQVDIPNHTHEIVHGIFEGPTPSALMVQVDGNAIHGLGTGAADVDIIPFLAKDEGGKVRRGWHEIKITPNNLGRVVATVVAQLFVQSRGGGDY